MEHAQPYWFIATLLGMLSVLMLAHLGMLWLGVLECDEYARILFERAKVDPDYLIEATNSECSEVEENFSNAAGQYTALILALMTGSGLAAKKGSN